MKKYTYKIITKLKDEIKNPTGSVIEDISKKLKIIVNSKINTGKFYEVTFDAKNDKEAENKINELASKVLINPIIETYEIVER